MQLLHLLTEYVYLNSVFSVNVENTVITGDTNDTDNIIQIPNIGIENSNEYIWIPVLTYKEMNW